MKSTFSIATLLARLVGTLHSGIGSTTRFAFTPSAAALGNSVIKTATISGDEDDPIVPPNSSKGLLYYFLR